MYGLPKSVCVDILDIYRCNERAPSICFVMMTLFKSLVLPRLGYGSQLWSPHLVKHIDQLEKIQRSFTKHITGMQS